MSYDSALEAAGATVHAYKTIGDYQGDWYALVTFNGVTGFVSGSYGSCSYCDAYSNACDDEEKNANWKAEFGAGYLTDIEAVDSLMHRVVEALDKASCYNESEARELVEWATKALKNLGINSTRAIAPFRATFNYDFGVPYDTTHGTPTEPGQKWVFDKIRSEIDDIGIENWLEEHIFTIRPNDG